jgi:type III secretion protein V
VILTSINVRRYLKKFLAARFPTWTVLSFQELPAHIQVQPVGRLSLQHALKRPVGLKL